jgi:hypothetical protein
MFLIKHANAFTYFSSHPVVPYQLAYGNVAIILLIDNKGLYHLTYMLMTINVFAIVLVLRQNCFKYIADLGALAKTNHTLAITLYVIVT